MTLGALVGMMLAVWLLSCGVALLAVYWNLAAARRLRAAFISSSLAFFIGCLGLWVQFKASKSVNGHVVWSINSRSFFLVTFILGGAALALTFWNWRKARHHLAPGSPAPGVCEEPGACPGAAPSGHSAEPAANPGTGGPLPSQSLDGLP